MPPLHVGLHSLPQHAFAQLAAAPLSPHALAVRGLARGPPLRAAPARHVHARALAFAHQAIKGKYGSLEPCATKVACTVLRGELANDAAILGRFESRWKEA